MIAEPSTADDLRSFLAALWRPGDVREVRIPRYSGRRVAAGYFDDPEALAAAVVAWDGRACIYVTLNPVNPALLARAANRINPNVNETTSDPDIVARRWLLVDIDPRRPSGISATDEESLAAREVAREVRRYLSELGWPLPLVAMTGNGYALFFAIDLPNDQASTDLVASVLGHLAARFDDERVAIDTTVSNASRIGCLVGTRKVKGDPTPDRPHRRSEIVAMPERIEVVPTERLVALAPPTIGQGPPTATTGATTGWVREWLDRAGVGYREKQRGGITWYRLDDCPFHPGEGAGDCGVGEADDGRGTGKCFHNRGVGKGWQEFRDALGLEPAPGFTLLPARSKTATSSETAGSPPAPIIVGIDAYRASVPAAIPWISRPLVYVGGVSLISGPPKAGKSTLAAQLQRCRETGARLFGAWDVTTGPTLLVTEEGGVPVVYKAEGMHALDVLDRRSALAAGLAFDGVLAVVREWGETNPGGLVFIDTLAIWAGIEDENDAGQTTKAIAAVAAVAQAVPLAIVLIHHARKSGGEGGTAIRGSGAILATVDIGIELSRVSPESDERYLDLIGRVILPERYRLRFDRATKTYTLADENGARLAEIEADLAGIPADGPGLTRNELTALWQKDPRARADQLVNVGRMRRDYVKQGRSFAWRYWSIPPVWTPEVRHAD